MYKYKTTSVYLALMGLIYCAASIPLYIAVRHMLFKVMVWNLFLAFLPLAFSWMAKLCAASSRKPAYILFGVLWLLFFPNSPYLVTDLIHLRLFDYHNYVSNVFDLRDWFFLLYTVSGVIIGSLCGLISLNMAMDHVRNRKGAVAADIFLAATALASGYGVYIGRFLRLNSWDIFNPVKLIQDLFGNTGAFALIFTLAMSAYILFSYFIFRLFTGEMRGKHDR